MHLDKDTIQHELNDLLLHAQGIEKAIKELEDLYQKIPTQIVEHRGALSYNAQLVARARNQLTQLAATAPASETPATS